MQRESQNSNGFLEELKSQFDRDLEIRKNHDSKITSLITMSSSVVTVLIGIGTFLVSHIVPKDYVFGVTLWILGLGILTAIGCIILLIISYSLRKYTFPMGHEQFFNKEEYDHEMIQRFRNASTERFTELMTEEYLASIKDASNVNSDKARYIKYGQIAFLISIGFIGLLLCYILIQYGYNAISLNF
jgi:hypothetical protein